MTQTIDPDGHHLNRPANRQWSAGEQTVGRRAVLHGGSLLIAGLAGSALPGCTGLRGTGDKPPEPLRIGLVTDVHYADRETHAARHYRDSLAKLASAVERFNHQKTNFVVELGDFIDSAETVEGELGHLKRIESVFRQAHCPRHHVLGNHCVYTLTKEQFLTQCPAPGSYYSFDVGGRHFVVLDGCFRGDGVPYGNRNYEWTDAAIPPVELDWLEADLAAHHKPTVVFVHQRLDVDGHYAIANRGEVRRRLETAGTVAAVFQGHNHINDLREINGIPYCTLTAMVEGPATTDNGYGILEIHPNGSMRLNGFGRQNSAAWAYAGFAA